MSSDNDFSKMFWIDQATHESARASHQRLLNNHLLNENLNKKGDVELIQEIQELRNKIQILQHDNQCYRKQKPINLM